MYGLRAEIRGHEEDVRGVLASDVGLVTSSRDKTIRVWVEGGAHAFQLLNTLVGHTDYVGPLDWVPPGALGQYPNGAIVSGSRDTTIRLWDPIEAKELLTLSGHTYQVTGVAVTPWGDLWSVSLDKTVRVWRDGRCVLTLEGHEGPVLSLVVLEPGGEVLTGSGDTTIRRWTREGVCKQVIRGHTDTVRALALLPGGQGFISGSHDQSVRVWTREGQLKAELLGHSALVYCVAAASGGLIASGSEDNTVRLWRLPGECVQVIDHPGCIWDLTFLEDEDLLTGCSDAVARVWTGNEKRQAPADVVAAYNELVAARRASASSGVDGSGEGGSGGGGGELPAGLKVEEPYALMDAGSKDGQTKLVREADGSVMAYSWSAAQFQWEKIGQVMGAQPAGAAGGGGKKFHAGQEWDYVFDVDVEDGAPPRKLPLNKGENPYLVAGRFLEQEELPEYFKEQVVQFIIQNTGGSSGPSIDPQLPITGGFCDPFTGGGSSASAPQTQPPGSGSTSSHIPASAFIIFDNTPPAQPLIKKLNEFAASLSLDSQLPSALSEMLDKVLSGPGAQVPQGAVTQLGPLLSWPPDKLFPVLDIMRVLVMDERAAQEVAELAGELEAVANGPGTSLGSALVAAISSGQPASQQTALRCLCNCFKQSPTYRWTLSQRGKLMDLLAPVYCTNSKTVRQSLSALLVNLSRAYFVGDPPALQQDLEGRMQALSGMVELLNSAPDDDQESIYRGVIAVGTLCHGDPELAKLAEDLGARQFLQSTIFQDSHQSRVVEACHELRRMITRS